MYSNSSIINMILRFLIDNEKPEFKTYSITQGLTSTILMGSFGSTTNKGESIEELKLCVLKPNTYNHNNIDSISFIFNTLNNF